MRKTKPALGLTQNGLGPRFPSRVSRIVGHAAGRGKFRTTKGRPRPVRRRQRGNRRRWSVEAEHCFQVTCWVMDGGDKNIFAIRSHEEIAAIMTERGDPLTRGRVWQLERSAMRKIRDSLEAYLTEVNWPIDPETTEAVRRKRAGKSQPDGSSSSPLVPPEPARTRHAASRLGVSRGTTGPNALASSAPTACRTRPLRSAGEGHDGGFLGGDDAGGGIEPTGGDRAVAAR